MIATLASDLLPSFGWLALALACLSLILAVGRALGARLQLRLWGIPEALLAGLLGLLLAPGGPLPLLPPQVMQLWADLPLVLLTLVFGSLLLGKPLPKLEGLWRPVSGQVSLALVLAFGQYVVGGLAVLLVLQPWLGVSPAHSTERSDIAARLSFYRAGPAFGHRGRRTESAPCCRTRSRS